MSVVRYLVAYGRFLPHLRKQHFWPSQVTAPLRRPFFFLDATASGVVANRTIGILVKDCLSYSTSATGISDKTVTSLVCHTGKVTQS